jgi:mannosyltransferase OCH1-like enzyme
VRDVRLQSIKPRAYKADLWRYCVLYMYGGVYMDIKFVLNYKLTDIINKYGSIFVKDIDYYSNSCKRGTFNGFMISDAKNPIFYDCIQQIVINYKNRYYGKNVLYPTGPCLLGYIIRSKYNHTPFKLHVVEGILGSPYTINDFQNNIIIKQYSNYRSELVTSNNIHYGELWKNYDIYS